MSEPSLQKSGWPQECLGQETVIQKNHFLRDLFSLLSSNRNSAIAGNNGAEKLIMMLSQFCQNKHSSESINLYNQKIGPGIGDKTGSID